VPTPTGEDVIYTLAADLVFIVHLAFAAFVVLGGLLVLRWARLAWLHVPALMWGVYTEFSGVVCPLTPLEVRLRQLGGQAGYQGDFVTHYLVPILYPAHLTRAIQLGLGLAALVPNLLIYAYLVRKRATR